VLLEVLPDPSLPQNGPGRWGQTGNFILDEFGMWAVPSAEGGRISSSASARSNASSAANRRDEESNHIALSYSRSSNSVRAGGDIRLPSTNIFFSTAIADWEQQYYRAEHAVDRNPKTGWAIGPKFGQRHLLIAELKEPLQHAGGFKVG